MAQAVTGLQDRDMSFEVMQQIDKSRCALPVPIETPSIESCKDDQAQSTKFMQMPSRYNIALSWATETQTQSLGNTPGSILAKSL